jgi:hypothetical protein
MKRFISVIPVLALVFISLISCRSEAEKTQKPDNPNVHSVALNDEPATPEVVAAEGTTTVSFDELSFDFGERPVDADFTHKFILHNTGEKDLVIETVKPSCSCTAPDWTREPIKPGESGFVTAKYNPQKTYHGAFTKTVTVKTNTEPGHTTLKITGEIVN